MKLIKSPLNYVGGKFKLLPQLLPLFPEKIDKFVDLFCGGGNVSVNVSANKIYCIDKQSQVIDFLTTCKQRSSEEMLEKIDTLIDRYDLTKTNKDGYYKLRDYYNSGNRTWDVFYTLVCYAFNNQIRFNSKGVFNMPFGERYFNPALRNKFTEFVACLKSKDISFVARDFRDLKPDKLNPNDFVYADPPYRISCASYNEGGGWTENDDTDLFNLLDSLNSNGVKFALSNVVKNNGMVNELLLEWSSKYTVHRIDISYSNSSYHRKRKTEQDTTEVLVTNY
jgi:DNA adenine methylase Dam